MTKDDCEHDTRHDWTLHTILPPHTHKQSPSLYIMHKAHVFLASRKCASDKLRLVVDADVFVRPRKALLAVSRLSAGAGAVVCGVGGGGGVGGVGGGGGGGGGGGELSVHSDGDGDSKVGVKRERDRERATRTKRVSGSAAEVQEVQDGGSDGDLCREKELQLVKDINMMLLQQPPLPLVLDIKVRSQGW